MEELNLPSATLKKIKKKLRFDNLVRVTLIPSIAEYKDAGLHLFLWCSQNELQCYKDSAYEDIKDFMRESNCENFTQAMKSLFQVENMIEQARMDASAAATSATSATTTTLTVIAEPPSPEKPVFEPVHVPVGWRESVTLRQENCYFCSGSHSSFHKFWFSHHDSTDWLSTTAVTLQQTHTCSSSIFTCVIFCTLPPPFDNASYHSCTRTCIYRSVPFLVLSLFVY